jgi:hypothetical protein
MPFILTGITHDMGFRVFSFAHATRDVVGATCSVRVDLDLARRYGIHLQELPLLCRGLLDRTDAPGPPQTLIFTEEEMKICANERSAKQTAVKKRRPPQRPSGELPGAAWRGHRL